MMGMGSMTAGLVRNRYVTSDTASATPARLVTMLYDRLVLDLVRAESAQRDGSRADAGAQLVHAQEIVLELMSGLRTDTWDDASGLLALYSFLYGELVASNLTGDAERTARCRLLVEPLQAAWHAAASEVAAVSAEAASAR